MYPELKGQKGVATKEVLKEDAPPPMALKVNVRYPENAPLPTVPPNLLANLPQLPEDLEYRIIEQRSHAARRAREPDHRLHSAGHPLTR